LGQPALRQSGGQAQAQDVAELTSSRVGLACGVLTAGLTGGILLGSLVATGINLVMSPVQVASYGWRIPFLLGGAFGLLSVYLRRLLRETPVFQELKAKQALAAETPLKAVVRNQGAAIVFSGLLTWMLSAAIVVVILMTPALMEKMYHISVVAALQANSFATIGLAIGCVLAGRLTDRFGPSRVLLVGCPLLGLTAYLLYTMVAVRPEYLMPLYGLTGFCVGIIAVVPYVMTIAFPPAIRFSGVSFSYNLAYAIFGGLTPVAVTSLLPIDRLAPAHYVVALSLLGFGTAALLPGYLWHQSGPMSGKAGKTEFSA
jgi:MFS family permease